MGINIEDKRLINSKLIMKLKDQSKVYDKHIALYSDLKGKPFSSYTNEKHPLTKEDVIVMKSKDNVVQMIISKRDTTFTYNYHPTYQLNMKASMALFTDLAETVFHSIIDIVKDVDDIDVMGCVNFLHFPTPSHNPSQMIFEQFLNIPGIQKIHTLNLSFSVESDNKFFTNYTFNKYEQKMLQEKPNNPVRPTREELKKAVKTGEGVQLIVDVNNRPFLRNGTEVFDKPAVTELLIFVRETILNVDNLFQEN